MFAICDADVPKQPPCLPGVPGIPGGGGTWGGRGTQFSTSRSQFQLFDSSVGIDQHQDVPIPSFAIQNVLGIDDAVLVRMLLQVLLEGIGRQRLFQIVLTPAKICRVDMYR